MRLILKLKDGRELPLTDSMELVLDSDKGSGWATVALRPSHDGSVVDVPLERCPSLGDAVIKAGEIARALREAIDGSTGAYVPRGEDRW
jgi:hypothetical protein